MNLQLKTKTQLYNTAVVVVNGDVFESIGFLRGILTGSSTFGGASPLHTSPSLSTSLGTESELE